MRSGVFEQMSNPWMEALDTLQYDPDATVPCPKCGKGNLKLVDAGLEWAPMERHLICLECNVPEAALYGCWRSVEDQQKSLRAWSLALRVMAEEKDRG